MTTAKAANTEPIPGYRLIEPLGSGGFGEVWKCEAPGGLFKAIKFVHGDSDDIHPTGPTGAQQELRALQHIKGLRHPFLLSMDRVEVVGGELVIVMELADRSLHDLLGDCRAAGRPGVPRAEVLRYFAEAAEVLDLLNEEHGLQHLDVKPRNLFLVGRHVKVADFGLVNSLAELSGSTPSALQLGAATPVYASPESFLGKITPFSDQYSLAIAYHELLVGEPPFLGKNFRQLALQHMQAEPDLRRLPEVDRPVVARALAKEPNSRFPSCTAFVQALQAGVVGDLALPAAAASRPMKSATLSDFPIAGLTTTPVGAHTVPPAPRTNAEIVLDTRTVRPVDLATAPERAKTGAQRAGDPLASWQFRECVARTSAGETWAARAPDGRDRLVRFFFGVSFANDGKEDARLGRLRALRHDALEPMEVVGGGEHRLALITDFCQTTLASRLQACQASGLPGVPRAELLDRLDEAAAALDELFEEYGLRHLGLAPRCLTLRDRRLRLLNFGLAELIHLPAGQSPGALNPRYSAPEMFEGRVNPSSDAYSLALIYCELLTGSHPFRSLSQRQMTTARLRGQPDLSLAPGPDRDVLQFALHPDPSQRFTSCIELIAALDGGVRQSASSSRSASNAPGASPDLTITPETRALMRQAVHGLVAAATGDLEAREHRNVRYFVQPGRCLEHQFFARLPPSVGRLKLEGFCQQWQAELTQSGERTFAVLAPTAGGVWQRLLGRLPALKIHIDLPGPVGPAASLTEVRVRLEPVRCGRDAAVRLLEQTGPQLLESLRDYLQALPERRNQPRLPFGETVQVWPVLDDDTVGDAVVSRAKDISLRGMGLYMPSAPPSMRIHIRLPGALPDQEVTVPACVVRAIPGHDGQYEVGVRFLVEEGTGEGGG